MYKIAVFSGNRAEWSQLEPVVRELGKVSIAYPIELTKFFDTSTLAATSRAIGSYIHIVGSALESYRPDILVAYGDRSETFAAVIAASQMGIPVAHIEGGDWTEGGCLDDNVRHAITKLSHLHFTTNQPAADRLRAIGEESWRVKFVGLPSLDYEHEQFIIERPLIIFCQHPVAAELDRLEEHIEASIDALERVAVDLQDCDILVIAPNGDAGSDVIRSCIDDSPFVARNLPAHRFRRELGTASAIVGNSSAGLKEAPSFGCPCVNIGTRQKGRLRGNNVIDVGYNADEIYGAIRTAMRWRDEGWVFHNPYYNGGAGKAIAETLATVELGSKLLIKRQA